MTTTTESWTAFLEGRAITSPHPFENPWSETVRTLMATNKITATWTPRGRLEGRAFTDARRIETPFPFDTPTGTIALHEVTHVMFASKLNALPLPEREVRCDEAMLTLIDAVAELKPEVEAVERACERGLLRGGTREELAALCRRPSLRDRLLGRVPEAGSNGHREVSDDELRDWYPMGPPV